MCIPVRKRTRVNYVGKLTLTGEYIIERTKTGSGCRIIPMTKEVKASMKCLCRNASCGKAVDGVKGFLTSDRNGNPTTASHWEHRLSSLVKKYNRTHERCLPHITPHVCRHTFCTLMAEQGLSLKTLQYLMGHSDVRVTMEVYTHVNMETVKRELLRAEGRKRL